MIRQDFLRCIAEVDADDVETKYKLGQAFKSYFIENKIQSLFCQYGDIYTEQLTGEIFEQYRVKTMGNWERCRNEARLKPTAEDASIIDAAIRQIIEHSIPLCKTKTLHSTNATQELSTEVEREIETLKEVEKEMQIENMDFDRSFSEEDRHVWISLDIDYLKKFQAQGKNSCMKSINQTIQITIFSESLLVDDNYAKVYYDQQDMLCPCLKAVFAVLFRQDGEQITACIIDISDLSELQKKINTDTSPKIWISNTQHTILAGSFPDGILENQDYQSLIEQIRFFNGECIGLSEQATPFHWLNINTEQKLTYFENNIMPYRQTKPSEFKKLQDRLLSKPLLYSRNRAMSESSSFNSNVSVSRRL